MPGQARRVALAFAPFVVLGGLWELLAVLSVLDPTFFPPPSETFVVAVDLYAEGAFLEHVRVSLRRVVLAVLFGGTAGIAVGLVAGWSREIRLLVNPHLAVLYPIPKIALLPVVISVFGVTETARVLVMGLAVFLLVTINTMGGVRAIDDAHVEAALDNGAGTIDLYREVILPGTLPQVFSGLSIGFSVGFALLVVVEMVAAESGLGYVIWNSWQLFTIPRMYVAIFTINVLGVVFVHGTEAIGDHLTPWADR